MVLSRVKIYQVPPPADCNHYNCNHALFSEAGNFQWALAQVWNNSWLHGLIWQFVINRWCSLTASFEFSIWKKGPRPWSFDLQMLGWRWDKLRFWDSWIMICSTPKLLLLLLLLSLPLLLSLLLSLYIIIVMTCLRNCCRPMHFLALQRCNLFATVSVRSGDNN